MSERSPAEMIAAHQKRLEDELVVPEGETALLLLQAVYKDKKQPLNLRVRCAKEALQFEVPKRSATAITMIDGLTYAQALEREERAMERSKQALMLNGPKTIEHKEFVSANDLKKPFQRNYRRFTSTR